MGITDCLNGYHGLFEWVLQIVWMVITDCLNGYHGLFEWVLQVVWMGITDSKVKNQRLNMMLKLQKMTLKPMKFYIRRNNNKVDSIEAGCIVIAHLLPWSDVEKYMYTTLF